MTDSQEGRHTDKPIVILGAGGHAKVLFDICRARGHDLRGFLDAAVSGPVHGLPVLGDDSRLDDAAFVAAHRFALGVGTPAVARRLAAHVAAGGGALATLVHPSAILSPDVTLGPGTVVAAGAVINIDTRIGARCVVNTRASIDHDCVLADGVQVCPGATLAGSVRVGEDAFIGTGATILPGLVIGAGAVIGGGATVIADVPARTTVVGPAARTVDTPPGGDGTA